MFAAALPKDLWAEELHHANWMRNRLPCSSIGNDIPLLSLDQHITIDYTQLYCFGAPGCAFLHYFRTVNKRLLTTSEFVNYFGTESNEWMSRVYFPETRRVRKVGVSNFHAI